MELTSREYQVCKLLVHEFSDKEVAHHLDISFNTARKHHANIMRKIGARNLAGITRWYAEHKFNISFEISPKLRPYVAAFLLSLCVYAEFINTDMIRVRTVRVQTARARKSGRKKETYSL